MTKRINARLGPARGTMRDRGEITRFFDGLELLEPGVEQPQRWRPAGVVSGGRNGLVRRRAQALGQFAGR